MITNSGYSIDQTAKCSVFHKSSRNAALTTLVQNFPQEALTVFSDRARKDFRDGSKALIVTNIDKTALRDVLDWIMQCVAEEKAVFFQTVSSSHSLLACFLRDIHQTLADVSMPQYEEGTPKIFTKYALAIEAATYLGIPARDFSEGLLKRLVSIARKNLMCWDEFEHFLDRYDDINIAHGVPETLFDRPVEGDPVATKLRQVAAYSVFFGWWRGVLNEDDTPDDMCFLDILRKQHPDLDTKLHEIAEQNEKDVRERWEKKRLEREGGGAGFDNADGGVFTGGGEGWDTADTGAVSATGGWDTDNAGAAVAGNWDTADAGAAASGWESAAAASGDSDKENAAPSGASSSWDTPAAGASVTSWEEEGEKEGKEDWADEMNEVAAPSSGPAW